ncbi:MAG: large conductance mechanosensitive channel [Patescibacteria group bacterium]|nr:MscL family protein [Candidatus Saccharibacteria bacterium]MDQ5963295.1 large conductance mechanosensitive channel [Patescibacteria group bacterium]
MAKHVRGFTDFVREQGVVGLAVGLAIGTAAGAAVKSIVEEFINPIIGYIVGGVSLDKQMWHTGLFRGKAELVFGWGAIIGAIITLLATAFVVYQIVHIAKLDRLDKKKEDKK